MEINTFCPECENGIFLYEMPKAGSISCKRCGKGRPATGNGRLTEQGAILQCGICEGREFYRQKDFNTKLGLWITGFIIIGAFVLFIKNLPLVAFMVLVAGALLDLALYFLLGDIVICYKCRAIYRGMPISAQLEGFDLKIHDRYEFKEKIKF